MKVISEEPITNSQAYKILKETKSESYRIERTIKYLEKVGFIEKGEDLLKELLDLGITKEKAIMIVNTIPKTNDEVRAILENEYDTEKAKKIIELVKKFSE